MKKFKIHPHIIDVISKIYQNDSTILYLNNEIVTNVQVSSGIRQGCTGSTSLLLLLTYLINLHLNQTQSGFRDEICYIPSLLDVDDGILLAQSDQEVRHDQYPNRIRQRLQSRSQQGQKFSNDLQQRHKSGQPARHQNHN